MGNAALSGQRVSPTAYLSIERELDRAIDRLTQRNATRDMRALLIDARRLRSVIANWRSIPPEPEVYEEMLERVLDLVSVLDNLPAPSTMEAVVSARFEELLGEPDDDAHPVAEVRAWHTSSAVTEAPAAAALTPPAGVAPPSPPAATPGRLEAAAPVVATGPASIEVPVPAPVAAMAPPALEAPPPVVPAPAAPERGTPAGGVLVAPPAPARRVPRRRRRDTGAPLSGYSPSVDPPQAAPAPIPAIVPLPLPPPVPVEAPPPSDERGPSTLESPSVIAAAPPSPARFLAAPPPPLPPPPHQPTVVIDDERAPPESIAVAMPPSTALFTDGVRPTVTVHTVALPQSIDPHLVLLADTYSTRADAYRSLRRKLQTSGNPRVIAVTSPGPREGKTSCAMNLALALLEGGRGNVLLIEANLYAPAIGKLLAFEPPECFSEQMRRHLDDLEAPWVVVEPVPKLHVMAVDPALRRAPILDPVAFASAIEQLKRVGYDHIVVDTPPVLVTVDANMIADNVDGVIFTALLMKSKRGPLRKAIEQVMPAPILGVLTLTA